MDQFVLRLTEREKEEFRIAILFVNYRESVKHLSEILSALPDDTRILRIDQSFHRMGFSYALISEKFKPVSFREEPEEIQIVYEYEDKGGHVLRRIKEVNYPTEVTFQGLKKAQSLTQKL